MMTFQSSMGLAKTLSILACCAAIFALQTKAAPSSVPATRVIEHSEQFGYLPSRNPSIANSMAKESLSKAISDFQSHMKINVTGIANDEAVQLMEAPRCGVPDQAAPGTGGRSKRYACFGKPWNKTDITYRVSRYTNQLSQGDVDQVIADAFALWAEHVPLRFKCLSSEQVDSQADIDICFVRGSHGDNSPFDGHGDVLAHTLSSGSEPNGDIHFDDDVKWTIGSNEKGTDIRWVAVHEIGHALGLADSDVTKAIMTASWQRNANVTLDDDDIAGIKYLYREMIQGNNDPDIHRDPSIDNEIDTNPSY